MPTFDITVSVEYDSLQDMIAMQGLEGAIETLVGVFRLQAKDQLTATVGSTAE